MQYIGRCYNFIFLPVASNDNEDLLSLPFPSLELTLIRQIKNALKMENAESGVLLCSRKDRKFFQEVEDAERYILLRYFSIDTSESTLRRLKRHILDRYLFPKQRKCSKKPK